MKSHTMTVLHFAVSLREKESDINLTSKMEEKEDKTVKRRDKNRISFRLFHSLLILFLTLFLFLFIIEYSFILEWILLFPFPFYLLSQLSYSISPFGSPSHFRFDAFSLRRLPPSKKVFALFPMVRLPVIFVHSLKWRKHKRNEIETERVWKRNEILLQKRENKLI